MHIHIHICHTELWASGPPPPAYVLRGTLPLRPPSSLRLPACLARVDQECIFYFGVFFIDNTVPGSPSGNGSQQAGLSTSIEDVWRCILVQI